MSEFEDLTWNKLLQEFGKSLENAIEYLENRDIENIPGAKEALIQRLNDMKLIFPKNNGDIFIKSINDKIQNAFFPNTKTFSEAFEKILKSRTHEQDFIINELLNGFVSSKAKAIASGTQGPIIDRMVEAFSKRNDFHIVDHQFFAMFGDPNKPRQYVRKQLEELINMFGLISKELVVERDVRTSEQKIYTFYTFPNDIIKLLEEKYLIIDQDLGYAYVSDAFDRNVFICMFLANIAINRDDIEKIGIYGVGSGAIISYFAATLEEGFQELTFEDMLYSYRNFVETKFYSRKTCNPKILLWGILEKFDVVDVLPCLSPRKTFFINPRDACGETLAPELFEEKILKKAAEKGYLKDWKPQLLH